MPARLLRELERKGLFVPRAVPRNIAAERTESDFITLASAGTLKENRTGPFTFHGTVKREKVTDLLAALRDHRVKDGWYVSVERFRKDLERPQQHWILSIHPPTGEVHDASVVDLKEAVRLQSLRERWHAARK